MKTVYQVLKEHCEGLRALVRVGVQTSDVADLGLFEEYSKMEAEGTKRTAIVLTLADRYNRSERTIRRIVAKFKRTVPIF